MLRAINVVIIIDYLKNKYRLLAYWKSSLVLKTNIVHNVTLHHSLRAYFHTLPSNFQMSLFIGITINYI